MNGFQFDALTRRFPTLIATRRQTILGLALAALMPRLAMEDAEAGPGCKNVGKKCKKDKDCCSGVCKGKKGKQDKGKCKAHDTGGCPAGQLSFACGGANVACTTSAGENGFCQTTTGNGAYCATNLLVCNTDCKKDADCRTYCGPDAACIRCTACGGPGGTACVGPADCD